MKRALIAVGWGLIAAGLVLGLHLLLLAVVALPRWLKVLGGALAGLWIGWGAWLEQETPKETTTT